MNRLAQLLEETTDVRELKRAVSVKLSEEGMATEAEGVSELWICYPLTEEKTHQSE